MGGAVEEGVDYGFCAEDLVTEVEGDQRGLFVENRVGEEEVGGFGVALLSVRKGQCSREEVVTYVDLRYVSELFTIDEPVHV